MFGLNNKVERLFICVLCFLVITMAGCASTGKPSKGSGAPSKADETPARQFDVNLDSINVVGNGDAVLLEASGEINFTSYKKENPSRIVIDLPDVGVTNIGSPMVVNNSFITEIVLTQAGNVGKIEIMLEGGVGHEIKAGEDSILVDLKRDIFISGETYEDTEIMEVASGDGEEIEYDTEPFEEEVGGEGEPVFVEDEIATAEEVEENIVEIAEVGSDAQVEAQAIEAAILPAATRLISVTTDIDRSGTVIKIKGNGMVSNYNTFGLEGPARLVIDVWDVESDIKKKQYVIGGPHIDKVRVGKHSDKVRFVFDSSMASMATHKIQKDGEYLVVSFLEDSAESTEVTPAPEPVEVTESVDMDEPFDEPIIDESVEEAVDIEDLVSEEDVEDEPIVLADKKSSSGYSVRDISFDVTEGVATLKIKRSGKGDYKVSESLDGKTILLDIQDTKVPEDLRMIMDATALGTPVASISSYQGSHDNANLLVKLAVKTLYDVSEDGSAILLDFILDKSSGISYGDAGSGIGGNLFGGQVLNEQGLPEKTYTGRKIDLEMVNVDVVDVIDFIAEVSNFNIITSGVGGKITLRLKDVPWDQAFELILSTEGLDKIQEGNIIRVAPLAQIRKQREDVLASIAATKKLEPPVTEFIRINYDDASSLISQISGLLSDSPDASATAHSTTNTLIIRDIPSAIDDIKEFIAQVDIPIPQVLIEARIVEASSNFARDLGVQWGFDTQSTGSKVHRALYGGSAIGGSGTYSQFANADSPFTGANNTLSTLAGITNYAVSLPAAGGAGSLGGIGMMLGKSGSNPLAIELKLTAGEVEGKIKIISRPRIITMDGQAAEITQGESIPFETSDASGTTATKFINAGLGLKVTPKITPDGSIIMEIDVENNSLGSFTTSAGEPSINEKRAKTQVLVKDGETTVIGGVIVSKESNSERGVPFLKDIPLIGWLFKARSVSDSQSELLIFITPTIILQSEG